MNAFHHMDNPDRVFAEMLRVLRPGGRLVLADALAGSVQVVSQGVAARIVSSACGPDELTADYLGS